jgi:hypothetical protein
VSLSCAPSVLILSNSCFLLLPITNSNHSSNVLPVYKHLRLAKVSLSSQVGSIPRGYAPLPIREPDLIPRKTWRKRDSNGKGARAITTTEIAERDLKAHERRDKKQRPATSEHILKETDEI